MLDNLRYFLMGLISAMAAFFSPIRDFMTAVVILFIVNFICGVTADIVGGHTWSSKKALIFILYCFIYFGLCAFIFACGHFMRNENGAVQCISYICYVALYIYGTNIIRNLKKCVIVGSALYRILDIIYFVLTFEFIKKIPYLKEYYDTLNQSKKENENEKID